MNCRTARQSIALWVGNDLSQPSVVELEAHLESCEDCQQHAENLLSSSSVLLAYNSQSLERKRKSVWPNVRRQLPDRPDVCTSNRWLSVQTVAAVAVVSAALLLAVVPDYVASPGVVPVGRKPNLDGIPSEFVRHYPDSTWESLEDLGERSTFRRARIGQNVGF